MSPRRLTLAELKALPGYLLLRQGTYADPIMYAHQELTDPWTVTCWGRVSPLAGDDTVFEEVIFGGDDMKKRDDGGRR